MIIDYQPRGVCSRRMTLEVEEGVIRSIRIQGGCDGNLQGISRLVEGMEVSEAIRRLDGIQCGPRPTSCPGSLGPGAEAVQGGVRDTGTHGVPVSLRLGEPVKLGNLLVRQLCRVQGERLAIVAYRPCELSDIIEAPVIGHAQEDPEPVSLCSEIYLTAHIPASRQAQLRRGHIVGIQHPAQSKGPAVLFKNVQRPDRA